MAQKYKYVYNKKTGHFIKKLNEDDTTTNNNVTTDTQQTDNKDASVNKISFKSVESDEMIQQLNAKQSETEQKFQTDLSTLQKLLDAAKVAASKKAPTGIYDPVETDTNVLNIMKKMCDMKKQHALDMYNIEIQKLTQLLKLSAANESYYRIPEKYKWLNESNIHTAKIYMKELIKPDDDHILKGMADFKRAFKDTNLLYGKDRDGYFVVAVDKEDFDSMYDTLEEIGYLRDEIIDTVMPQLFDRHEMIN